MNIWIEIRMQIQIKYGCKNRYKKDTNRDTNMYENTDN